MDDLKFGAMVRAVRRRRGWRQLEVASRAGVGQWAVSCVERGDVERLPLGTLRRICTALEIALQMAPRWRGGELPRLVDARHAAIVEAVATRLLAASWEILPEYTFSHYRESGSVDVLGWHAKAGALLLVEVKSELDDLQNMLSVMDRKVRLVPGLIAEERGWRAKAVSTILAVPDTSSVRLGVARHRATFEASLPQRNVEVKRWIAAPDRGDGLRGAGLRGNGLRGNGLRGNGLRGIWFLHLSDRVTGMDKRGGPRRVRRPVVTDSEAPRPEIPLAE